MLTNKIIAVVALCGFLFALSAEVAHGHSATELTSVVQIGCENDVHADDSCSLCDLAIGATLTVYGRHVVMDPPVVSEIVDGVYTEPASPFLPGLPGRGPPVR